MIFKIVNVILVFFSVFMGIKQGWAMIMSKPIMIEMFGKWGFSKMVVTIFGIFSILSAIMILIPKTFLWGNYLMAAFILMIICFLLGSKDLKGVAIEIPFLLLNLAIIYFQYPFKS